MTENEPQQELEQATELTDTEHATIASAEAEMSDAEAEQIARRLVIVGVPILLCGVGYALLTRPFKECAAFAGSAAALTFASLVIVKLREKNPRKTAFKEWLTIAVVLSVFAAVAGPAALGCIVATKDTAMHVITSWPASCAAIVLFVGLVLFFFRLRLRFVYGLTEVVLGVVLGMQKLSAADLNTLLAREKGMEIALATLAGGVYLVVRGADNMHQGAIGSTPDAALAWVKRKLWSPRTPESVPDVGETA